MPLYEYECSSGHVTETIRRYLDRDDPKTCKCGQPMTRRVSRPHCPPDGVYSYAPNQGDANVFERRHEMIRKQRSDTGSGVALFDRDA